MELVKNFSALIGLVIVGISLIVSLILGWKPVRKLIGPIIRPSHSSSHSSSDVDAFSKSLGTLMEAARFSLQIVLSMVLGYIFLFINITKFIIKRVKAKQARDAMQAASVENGQSGEDTIKT